MEGTKCIQKFAEHHHEPVTEKAEKPNQTIRQYLGPIERSPVDELGGENDAIVVVIKSQEHPTLRLAGPDGKQDSLGRSGLGPSQH